MPERVYSLQETHQYTPIHSSEHFFPLCESTVQRNSRVPHTRESSDVLCTNCTGTGCCKEGYFLFQSVSIEGLEHCLIRRPQHMCGEEKQIPKSVVYPPVKTEMRPRSLQQGEGRMAEREGEKREEESSVGFHVKMVNGFMLMGRHQTTLSDDFEDFSGKRHPFCCLASDSQCKWLCCQVARSQLDIRLSCRSACFLSLLFSLPQDENRRSHAGHREEYKHPDKVPGRSSILQSFVYSQEVICDSNNSFSNQQHLVPGDQVAAPGSRLFPVMQASYTSS